MTTYTDRPWLSLYDEGKPKNITLRESTILGAFRATVDKYGDSPAIYYFDSQLSWSDVDDRSDALAEYLLERGFAAGDRLAVDTQNNPAFIIGAIAAWKAGGAVVTINPMNKEHELTYLFTDSQATALLCLDDLWAKVASHVVGKDGVNIKTVITCSASDELSTPDERVMPTNVEQDAEVARLADILADGPKKPLPRHEAKPDDVAVLSYTSGTTGRPKGAMNTQENVAFGGQALEEWVNLTADDRILAIAPLFHITGFVCHVGVSLYTGAALVLAHRFEPRVMLDTIRDHRPSFTLGAITAFMALVDAGTTRDDWASFRLVYSGGAPIAPGAAARFERATGHYIHNAYGLTETSAAVHAVPANKTAPVDAESGALSIGTPMFGVITRILGDDGQELPVGEVGELAIASPHVVSGYWNRPDATAESLPGGELRTGDVGFMDEDGWFYLVDRKKDMINASGYKVWPREVEDALYQHEAVREAAVVGIPDEYRGETVKAFVSLIPGATITGPELSAWAKERMSAYKYPREVEIIEELPKTPTGKILRRELRPKQ